MPKKLGSTLIVFLTVFAFLFLLFSVSVAAMPDYENLPPFAKTGVQSNVLLVMDYSGSMQAPAHHNTAWGRYYHDSWTNNNIANYGDGTLDDSAIEYENYWVGSNNGVHRNMTSANGPAAEVTVDYNPNNTYYGYYEPEKYYAYDSGAERWYIVGDSTSGQESIGLEYSICGNLLNFLIMSRIDVSLKALIGGKESDCYTGKCLEPQGSERYVSFEDMGCVAYVGPQDPTTGNYTTNDQYINIKEKSGSTCPVAFDEFRQTRVKKDKERSGIVQNNIESIRFGFITFAGNNEGTIKHTIHDSNMTELISSLEDEVPYGGTPTGQAMWEAHNYLRQVVSFTDDDNISRNYEDNDGYIDKDNSIIDPYYAKVGGLLQPAWCRKSFVVLISDGVWNQGVDPSKPAHIMHTEDLRNLDNNQTAKVYSLFSFADDVRGENSMKTVSMFGNFKDDQSCPEKGWPYPFNDYPSDSRSVSYPLDACDSGPSGNYDACCAEWDEKDNNGIPDAYFSASKGSEMESALTEIFAAIRSESSSGTSVSALTEEGASGALVNQAVFYPEKIFGDQEVNWIGYLYAYWFLNKENIQNLREDTESNKALDIKRDYILDFTSTQGNLEIEAYNSSSNGSRESKATTYNSLDEITPVWEAGTRLQNRNASDRRILAVSNSSSKLVEFTANNADQFKTYLGSDTLLFPDAFVNGSQPEYSELIRYVRGEDISQSRSRCTGDGTWKLGDIIHSTPTVVSYRNYSLVFAGANDGMLHAFRMGELIEQSDDLQPVKLANDYHNRNSMDKLGREEWAFVPRNAMPYLRFLANPNYSHINTVDLKPYVIEMEGSERRILIGGMRFGGGTGETSSTNSVNPPADTCTDPTADTCTGRSAYFALDVTDPQNPEHLWTFSHKDLGFSYSGPAHVKRKDSDGNRKHFVLFGSGPTDYDGTSEQELTFFVLDLEDGTLERATSDQDDPSSMNKGSAFGGRLFTEGLDVNGDRQTDYVLSGYSQQTGSSGADGGVISIYTGGIDPDPDWDFEKTYLNAENPVVGGVASMKCFGQWYIYFGTGQYFNRSSTGSNQENNLYGSPFTCDAQNNCNATGINQVANTSDLDCGDIYMESGSPEQASWRVELNAAQGDFFRERSYSKPSITSFNTVIFDSAMPTSRVCEFGGKSRSWARNCATGWAMSNGTCENYAVDETSFKYLVQLSGGDIQQYSWGDFSEGSEGFGKVPFTTGLFSDEGGKVVKWKNEGLGDILLWLEK